EVVTTNFDKITTEVVTTNFDKITTEVVTTNFDKITTEVVTTNFDKITIPNQEFKSRFTLEPAQAGFVRIAPGFPYGTLREQPAGFYRALTTGFRIKRVD
uniref:hypothetical protein n=1 Tax=Oscillatoria sp. HE19RPO TaxID=2954806 RepID=UPI0020C26525